MPKIECTVTILYPTQDQPATQHQIVYGRTLQESLPQLCQNYNLYNRFGQLIPLALPVRGNASFIAKKKESKELDMDG